MEHKRNVQQLSQQHEQHDGQELRLRVNEMAEGHEYFVLGGWTVSPDNRLLAYAVDTAGDERCVARIRDLDTGEILDDELVNVQGGLTFSADGLSLSVEARGARILVPEGQE